MPSVNVARFLPLMAGQQPWTPAIFFPHGVTSNGLMSYTHLTYRQLDEDSDLLAAGLERLGIRRGTRTVLMVRPSLELFCLVFALFKAGIVPIMIDPGLGVRSLAACLENAQPEAFIGVPAAHVARVLLGWGRKTMTRLVTVGHRWFWSGATLAQVRQLGRQVSHPSVAATRADEMAAILFTSGSTGPPKGVVYSHGNFVAQVDAIRSLYQIKPGEVDLPTFPLFALFDPALGMTTIVPDMDPTRPAQVVPSRIIQAIEDFGVTNMFGSPALLNTVGRWGAARQVTLPTLKRVISAGAPVPASVMERFARMLCDAAQIHTPYGATEALPVSSISSSEVLLHTRAATDQGKGVCVGKPVPEVTVRIIATSDDVIPVVTPELELGPGEIGEITVQGPAVTSSYFNAEHHTQLAKTRLPHSGEILHRMGDLGYLDEHGRLWFCGRKAQRVVTARQTLYTVPCEAVFNVHPDVFRTALVGVTQAGETTPVLCVELEQEHRTIDRSRLEQELLALGAAHQHTRQIRRILFHPRFPVDVRHNAKIGRGKLAAWAQKHLS